MEIPRRFGSNLKNTKTKISNGNCESNPKKRKETLAQNTRETLNQEPIHLAHVFRFHMTIYFIDIDIIVIILFNLRRRNDIFTSAKYNEIIAFGHYF